MKKSKDAKEVAESVKRFLAHDDTGENVYAPNVFIAFATLMATDIAYGHEALDRRKRLATLALCLIEPDR